MKKGEVRPEWNGLGPVYIWAVVSAGADFRQGKERVAPWGGSPTSRARRRPGKNAPRPEGVRPNWPAAASLGVEYALHVLPSRS